MLRAAVLSFCLLAPPPARADEVQALYETPDLPRMVAVMRAEGVEYGDQIARDIFAGRDPAGWEATVRRIYDRDRMEAAVLEGLRAELAGKDVAAMSAFFTEEPGKTIVSLEVSGREALLDDAVEDAARDAAEAADGSARMEQIRRYIAANDLVDANVAGALNANFAFHAGLVDGGAFDFDLTEDEILTEVWAQEPAIRHSTTDWVEAFLLMAYAPLRDDDLEAHIAFSETPAGRDMNAALFAAFDPVFEAISRALGRRAARYMAGEDL